MKNIKDNVFFKRTDVSESIEKSIKNEFLCRNFYFNMESFNSNQLTECPRKLSYQVKFKTDTNPPWETFSNNLGRKHFIDKWEEILTKNKSIKIVAKNILTSDANYNLRGEIDFVIRFDDTNYITKIYNENIERKHILDITLCMWMEEKNNGLIILDNIENQDIKVFQVMPKQNLVKASKDKLNYLNSFNFKNEVPERPYETKNNLECKSCIFNNKCW
jgi:CRISPR/Cas system-associated exonuclease Cas4 (RecB family)